MSRKIRPEKCAFFYRKKFVGDFCLCDEHDPFKRCNGVCALYMSEQKYKAFMAQVLAEAKENKD